MPGGISLRGESSHQGAIGPAPRCCQPGWAAVSGDQAQVACARYGLGPVGGPELAQDVGHVFADRVERHYQVVRDALI